MAHRQTPNKSVEKAEDVATRKIGPEDEAQLAIYESILASVTKKYSEATQDRPQDFNQWLIASGTKEWIEQTLCERFGATSGPLIEAMHDELKKFAADFSGKNVKH